MFLAAFTSRSCVVCRGTPPDGSDVRLHGRDLAKHFLDRKLREWERSVPVWTCYYGRSYKRIPSNWGGGEDYDEACPDGLMGERVGQVVRHYKTGKVKRSDACPGCKRRSADADRLRRSRLP